MKPLTVASRASLRAKNTLLSRRQIRCLSLHEYQSYDLLREFEAPVPAGKVVKSPQEARTAASSLGGSCTLKPQILHRRRHNGSLDSGLQVGILSVGSATEAEEAAARLMGDQIQDGGGEGHPVEHVYVSESVEPEREWYLAMTVDRENYCPAIVLSDKAVSDMSRESVTIPFRLTEGIISKLLERVSTEMNLPPNATESLKPVLDALYGIFSQKDATLLEINRLALLPNGTLTCLDASFTFDDAAHKRQPELFSLRDTHQEVSEEVEAEKYGLVYVRMDGDIGNVVNGAGLAMATNDAIGLYGGKSANFLDGGGQATKETMVKAFGIIVADERVKVILVNIYGGITDGRMIAESIIGAAEELGPLRVPMVVRLQGTNSAEGLKLLEEANLGIHVEADFGAAAKMAVDLAKKAS